MAKLRRWNRSKQRRTPNGRSTSSEAGDTALEREFKQLGGRDTSGDKLLEDPKRKMGQIEDKSSESSAEGRRPIEGTHVTVGCQHQVILSQFSNRSRAGSVTLCPSKKTFGMPPP